MMALTEQIGKDIEATREYFRTAKSTAMTPHPPLAQAGEESKR